MVLFTRQYYSVATLLYLAFFCTVLYALTSNWKLLKRFFFPLKLILTMVNQNTNTNSAIIITSSLFIVCEYLKGCENVEA